MKQFVFSVFIVMMLLQCGQVGEVSSHGGGDDVTTAVVLNPDGSFAAKCSVIMIPASAVPGSDIPEKYETITDSRGRFSFTALPSDTYNIYVKKDDFVSFAGGVVIRKTAAEKVLPDITLGPSGSISGIVRLWAESDSRTVRIMIIGGTVSLHPEDAAGRFSIPGLAEGTYHIRFQSPDSMYLTVDTTFTVASGEYLDIGTVVLSQPDQPDQPRNDTVVVRDSLVEGVWGPDKTYEIMCDIKIHYGTRLEIREGTRLVFMGQYDFQMEGNCIARGTVDKPVVFTYGLDFTGRGWNYLNCKGPVTQSNLQPPIDTVLFDNCILEKFHWLLADADHPDFYFAMTNCIVRDAGGLEFITSDMRFNSGKGFYIRNNVFHNVGPFNSSPTDMANCARPLWVQNGNYETWQCNDPCVQVTNNIFYDLCWNNISYRCYFPYSCYPTSATDIPADSTCVYGDPLFEDINNGNYRLKPNSPCIGTGKDGVDMGLIFTDDR